MNLVRAELERLTARRFVQLMVVLLVLAFAVTAATTLAGSHRPTPAELSQAQAQAAAERGRLEEAHDRCLQIKAGQSAPEESDYIPGDCSEIDPARMERVPVAADFLPGVFNFATQARPLLYFLVAFLVLFGFLVGASYIGADLNSGGVVNLLLWRPRRLAVLGAKLGTLLGALLVLSAVASAAYLAVFWLIGQTAGLPGHLDGEFWRSLGATYGRGLVLVLLAATLGFAIATLGRHTAAALGTVAAYLVVWELGARLVLQILDAARPDQWMISSYLIAWLSGEARFWDNHACRGDVAGYCDGMYTLSWAPGLAVLLSITVLLAVAAFGAFRRRDLI
ncbi:ABC-2 family transporter protein [Micromonospora rhizosphaerae]|uniref:ABC-2 family transporter protein n=1 Tax=Micromonospora rhizosphaerae TaxID=568872 RepID=A0A1C6RV43_9ACTN|nr:ABC transporter permease subunit [Micromonospora rhizosphaerae]SCL20929.1 ABC-2 family transporter protein [Micromonospora rhizosphaerae]